jgi:hypothetical protein
LKISAGLVFGRGLGQASLIFDVNHGAFAMRWSFFSRAGLM